MGIFNLCGNINNEKIILQIIIFFIIYVSYFTVKTLIGIFTPMNVHVSVHTPALK